MSFNVRDEIRETCRDGPPGSFPREWRVSAEANENDKGGGNVHVVAAFVSVIFVTIKSARRELEKKRARQIYIGVYGERRRMRMRGIRGIQYGHVTAGARKLYVHAGETRHSFAFSGSRVRVSTISVQRSISSFSPGESLCNPVLRWNWRIKIRSISLRSHKQLS
jgi:hypothetical protein